MPSLMDNPNNTIDLYDESRMKTTPIMLQEAENQMDLDHQIPGSANQKSIMPA